MFILDEMLQRVELVQNSIIELTAQTVQQTEEEFDLVQLNKNQLYDDGEDAKEFTLRPYRSPMYAEMKYNMRGDGKELTDLFLSGEFQRGFHILIQNDQYSITSSDEKTQKLISMYGEDIFGIADKNKEKAFLIIRPSLIAKVAKILGVPIV